MSLSVGFIGLGDQGAPMACAIAQAGFPLHVWARRPATLAAVARVPHTACESVASLAAAADVVGLCVRTDDDVSAVLSDLLPSMRPGGIVANHGTGSPDICANLERLGSRYGVAVLDAPVSGGSVGAAAKTLTTMVAGDESAAKVAQPVFEAFSRLVIYLGRAGSAQLAKLLNNVLFAANLKNTEDILWIAERVGVDVGGFMRILLASSGASFAAEALSAHIPAGRVDQYQQVLSKDLAHFAVARRARGVPEQPIEQNARLGIDGMAASVGRLPAPVRSPRNHGAG